MYEPGDLEHDVIDLVVESTITTGDNDTSTNLALGLITDIYLFKGMEHDRAIAEASQDAAMLLLQLGNRPDKLLETLLSTNPVTKTTCDKYVEDGVFYGDMAMAMAKANTLRDLLK